MSCLFFFFLMIRRPPRSTRTDTLCPYTTLFRSWCPGTGSNRRHCDFQSHALPTELPGHIRRAPEERGALSVAIVGVQHRTRICDYVRIDRLGGHGIALAEQFKQTRTAASPAANTLVLGTAGLSAHREGSIAMGRGGVQERTTVHI